MMKLRTKFILFVVILHLIVLVLSYFILNQHKLLFIISEVFILISILLAWQLYKKLIQPLQLLIQGTEALREKDFNIRFTPTGQYEMDQLIGVYNQMTDELRGERLKQQQQHVFLGTLIETSPTGILILDFNENIHDINPKALKLLNITEEAVIGKPLDALDHPLMLQIKNLVSGTAKSITINGANTYKLQKSHFIDRGFARHFVMIEELTTDILAAEKNAYGKVIRMMAHEVNNTIGAVNSIIQSSLHSNRIWEGTDSQLLKDALQMAFDRNKNLSIFMRNFADVVRLPEPQRKSIDLHQLIYHIGGFMEARASEKDIRLHYELDKAPFHIIADGQQIEQALINVVKNAIEAIDDDGIITFTTDTITRQLVVVDNGRGISTQDASQLFSPFFSTKRDGQGIGLTLVKEILLNHGYEFSLQTTSARNTSFVFRFREG
jgi:two-component system nitrogen regulation sensor histidine kinase NtrY